jgi:kynureninase
MPIITSRQDCQALDAADRLRPLRDMFHIPEGMIYLDGNSLGAMPKAAAARATEVVTQEWGQGLIGSWNAAGWFTLPHRLGRRIAPLIGAGPDEVVSTDSTSINLFKVLHAALHVASKESPSRRRVVSERINFPTDLYIAQALCSERGYSLTLVESDEVIDSLNDEVAVLLLTHVNYRTGAMHDMAVLNAAAHRVGALVVWDLAHSAGAVPVALKESDADYAVGCGYKYLNGGPGAPAFVWTHPRLVDRAPQPLAGWWGHASPFAFTTDYLATEGVGRYLCGTQPVVSMSLLDCGLEVFEAAASLGGMPALRTKSLALSDLFIRLVEERCDGHGLSLVTPREHARRGSQICLTRRTGAFAIVQALIARGIVGDFRAGDGASQPDILRFGFAPLYIGFDDVWNAVDQLREVLESGEWQRDEFHQQRAVT